MSGTIPTLQALVTVIKDNGNYANFFVLGMAFNITPKQLHDYLMELEKLDLIDLSAIAEPQDYEQATLDTWSIPQISGGNLFFASVPELQECNTNSNERVAPDATDNVPVEKVSQGTRQTRTKKATVQVSNASCTEHKGEQRTVDGAGKQKTTAPDTSKENKSTKDNDMTSATSTIETLIQSIEAQAFSTKPTYRTMQSLLKTARETHNIELQVVLNKAAKVLQEECRRIVNEFKAGTVKTREPKQEVKKEAKVKAKTPVTHTSDKVEAPAPVSEPKQTSADLLLKEAQAEIEALRRQLADKTNEVAEYAEALQHANDTVKKQQQALELQKQVITTLTANQAPVSEPVVEQAPVITEPAVEVVAEVEADEEWEDDNSDAVDAMMVLLIDGKREVIAYAVDIVEAKLGKVRAGQFVKALNEVDFLNFSDYAQAFRNLMDTYKIKMAWVEQAVDKATV